MTDNTDSRVPVTRLDGQLDYFHFRHDRTSRNRIWVGAAPYSTLTRDQAIGMAHKLVELVEGMNHDG